jgi:hypothetical protein
MPSFGVFHGAFLTVASEAVVLLNIECGTWPMATDIAAAHDLCFSSLPHLSCHIVCVCTVILHALYLRWQHSSSMGGLYFSCHVGYVYV